MTRCLPEWRGKTPDTAPPPRVIARLFLKQEGRCTECGRKIGVGGEPFDADHIIALVNGGENTEANLRLVCVSPCHRTKSAADLAEKAETARKRNKLVIGATKRSRFACARSGRWKMKIDGTVERRDR